MAGSIRAVLDSVLDAAVDATAAMQGWLLEISGDALVVRSVAGADAALVGRHVPIDAGFAGYVASSGQPIAMTPHLDDERAAEGIAALVGSRPTSVLAVPCTTEAAVHGVIELVTKRGGGSFSLDDVEIVTLLGGIAGATLAIDGAAQPSPPSPTELGPHLVHLWNADPVRYAAFATLLTQTRDDD